MVLKSSSGEKYNGLEKTVQKKIIDAIHSEFDHRLCWMMPHKVNAGVILKGVEDILVEAERRCRSVNNDKTDGSELQAIIIKLDMLNGRCSCWSSA